MGPRHLLNIKQGIERRENMLWFRVPSKVYYRGGCLEPALGDLKGKERAFIVTGKWPPFFQDGVRWGVVCHPGQWVDHPFALLLFPKLTGLDLFLVHR